MIELKSVKTRIRYNLRYCPPFRDDIITPRYLFTEMFVSYAPLIVVNVVSQEREGKKVIFNFRDEFFGNSAFEWEISEMSGIKY